MTYSRYKWGELKARIAAMAVGVTLVVPAYSHGHGRRPSPKAMAYGRDFGYRLECLGYGTLGDTPVAFLRRVA